MPKKGEGMVGMSHSIETHAEVHNGVKRAWGKESGMSVDKKGVVKSFSRKLPTENELNGLFGEMRLVKSRATSPVRTVNATSGAKFNEQLTEARRVSRCKFDAKQSRDAARDAVREIAEIVVPLREKRTRSRSRGGTRKRFSKTKNLSSSRFPF